MASQLSNKTALKGPRDMVVLEDDLLHQKGRNNVLHF